MGPGSTQLASGKSKDWVEMDLKVRIECDDFYSVKTALEDLEATVENFRGSGSVSGEIRISESKAIKI